MTSGPGDAGGPAPEDDGVRSATSAAPRRGPLADLDLLPETTSDEAGGHGGRSDEDYRSDRPPHHGD